VVEKDLLANKGKSLVIAGEQQPPEVHALAARLNALLGNVGQTISYIPEFSDRKSHREEIAALVADLNAGGVDTVILVGGNPVYNAPSDLSFDAALAKAKTVVR